MESSYFCTAGGGTEIFLADELKFISARHSGDLQSERCSSSQLQVEGKVLFTFSGHPAELLNLKTAERVFVQLCHKPHWMKQNGKDSSIMTALQNTLEAITPQDWDNAKHTWDLVNPPKKQSAKFQNNQKSSEKLCNKRQKTENDDVTFRVSLKCPREYNNRRVSSMVGGCIIRQTGWKVDLRKPLFEVYIQLNNNHLIIGIPLTKIPLSDRPYIETIGLRSTVAWIMAHKAQIQAGDTVLDPMCGVGTILIEAANSWKNASYIGCDTSEAQLALAERNIQCAGLAERLQVIQADTTNVPLKVCSVNAVVCDLPFGQQHGTAESVKKLYPAALHQIHRVLKNNGHLVLLTSKALKPFLLACIQQLNKSVNSQTIDIKPTEVIKPSESIINIQTDNRQTFKTSQSTLSQTSSEQTYKICNHVRSDANMLHGEVDVSTNKDIQTTESLDKDCQTDRNLVPHNDISRIVKSEQHFALTLVDAHDLKLGDTHACICTFRKTNERSKSDTETAIRPSFIKDNDQSENSS